jgi:hypothetical protein
MVIDGEPLEWWFVNLFKFCCLNGVLHLVPFNRLIGCLLERGWDLSLPVPHQMQGPSLIELKERRL